MSKEAAFDIRAWVKENPICPNCGMDLKNAAPEQNMAPHWFRGCVSYEDGLAFLTGEMKREVQHFGKALAENLRLKRELGIS